MPTLVQIPIAIAEYIARFKQPNLRFFFDHDRQSLFEAMALALMPYDFRLANVEVTAGALADQKLTFKLPDLNIVIQINAEEYKFTKDKALWASAEQDLAILEITRALLEPNHISIKSQFMTLALHIQPKGVTRDEILRPFIPEPFNRLSAERKINSFGTHVKFADSEVLLDFSVPIANGIFIRLNSSFANDAPLDAVVQTIRKSQRELFEMLGVEEDL